jgi:hypothetical protein
MPPAKYRLIKRPMTEYDRGLVIKYYQGIQKILRMIAFLPLVLFFVTTLVASSGETAGAIISILLLLVTVILGIVVIGMSIGLVQMRKNMAAVLNDGMAIEVLGLAFRTRTKQNVVSYAVGPITLTARPEVLGMIHEGGPVSVLCIPRLKFAFSVNNVALAQGAGISCPPNLDAMAEPYYPAAQQPMAPAYSQYIPPAPQAQTPQYQQPYYQPSAPPQLPPRT